MSSGDLLADRRMELARALHERGDVEAALDLLEQALELAPGWTGGHFLLAEWYEGAVHRDEAVAAYTRCLQLDPDDRLGAVLRLALLGAVAEPRAAPPAYVAGVFDDYADAFDGALLERLDYRVPGELARLVVDLAGPNAQFVRTLDLGCGTGLAGERFRSSTAWLEGIDLSDGMIAHARRKGLYDQLERADAVAWLQGASCRYDLIVAADVLVYLGDLAPLVSAAGAALLPGGRLVFSVEASTGDGFRLTAGCRFAHGEGYLRSILTTAGLEVEASRRGMCRLEKGEPVQGLFMSARRPAAASGASPSRHTDQAIGPEAQARDH